MINIYKVADRECNYRDITRRIGILNTDIRQRVDNAMLISLGVA